MHKNWGHHAVVNILGRLHSMRLILYGTKEDPLAINPHVNNSSKEIMQFTPNEINERKKGQYLIG